MRVVAGMFGGRTLVTPPGKAVRPTSSLVRGAMFNSLGARGAIEDATVVDLFAGSGALGIEALSRGARRVEFVEEDPRAIAVIEANLTALGVTSPDVDVRRTTVERWLAGRPSPVDIALADPPYKWDGWAALLDGLASLPAAIVVAEAEREIAGAGWQVAAVRRHGGTVVTQLSREIT